MRLIDADKLREKLIIDYEVRETYFGEILLKEIDESPTVENITVFCENADEKTIEDLKAELQSVIEARPQGEWIVTAEDNDGVHRICCPFCSYEKGSNNTDPIIVTFTNFPKFCENCGADMRKGGAE